MMNHYEGFHPAVLALHFFSVLLFTVFTANPYILILSLLGGMVFGLFLVRKKEFLKDLVYHVGLFLLAALTNPLFSHNGATPLFFFNGNAVTLEAVLYGLNIGTMLLAALYWFKCFHIIMTSDKLLFLLGQISPKISLVLSAALRFIPLLKNQAKKIQTSQKAMGLYTSENWLDKLRSTMRVYSALITWSLENAVDTGASMTGRGYGIGKRTHFALFRFTKMDGVLMTCILFLDSILTAVMVQGRMDFSFYPRITVLQPDNRVVMALTAFGLLCFLPAILEGTERIQWNYYKSKI